MGFSSTFTELIFIIASVTLASGASIYAFYMGSLIQSNANQIVSDARDVFSVRVEIVYATICNETPVHYIIYAKNIGYAAINNYDMMDVLVGPYGSATLYHYSQTPQTGYFTFEDSDGDGIWEVGETAIIRAYASSIQGVMFEARIKPFRGLTSSYIFTSP